MHKKVLIAGASGLVGQAAIEHFTGLPGWQVVGVSRRVPAGLAGADLRSIDLTDAAACHEAFGAMADVTHLVYAALHEIPGLFSGWVDPETISQNGAMLRNLFEPLSLVAKGLEHVSLLHGTKAYGLHHPDVGMRGVRIPLRERAARIPHPNFYFLQEDYLREKQANASWGLSVFRPTVIYGEATGNNMNPIPAIGAYAAILRERGEPLYFPGRGEAPAIREAVDAALVARTLAWAAESPAARGETFNITNGDVFMWENVWPAIAASLDMEPGERRPFSFRDELPALEREWQAVVRKHALKAPESLADFVGYNSMVYTDMVLSSGAQTQLPVLNSTIKLRQAGFADCLDTEEMFTALFARMRAKRLLP